VTSSLDAPIALTVRDARGDVVVARSLTDVVPPRALLVPGAVQVSGLSFTGDERQLYFVAVDHGTIANVARLVRVDLASGAVDVVEDELRGWGGSITPEGTAYVHARVIGDRAVLAAYSLAKKNVTVLADLGPRHYVVSPRVSPRGDRVVAAVFDGRAWSLALFDRATGARLADVPTPGGQALEPSFAGDDRVLFAAPREGRLQIHEADLTTSALRVLTDAPYLALAPFADGASVRFLNRDGWTWSLDEVEVNAPADVAAAPPPTEPPPAPRVPAADWPYSAWTGILPPQAWGFDAQYGTGWARAGAALAGGDKLGYHRYYAQGGYVIGPGRPYGEVAYLNTQLAPFFLTLDARYAPTVGNILAADGTTTRVVSDQWSASLDFTRPIYTSSVGVHVDYEGYRRDGVPGVLEAVHLRRLVGAGLSASYSGVESTTYVPRRGVLADARLTTYPEQASDAGYSIADARASLHLIAPLPLWARHTLRLDLAGRALAFAPTALGLLQVGGTLVSTPDTVEVTGLPPGRTFAEPVHGFETLALFGSRAAIAELTYRAPLIIDKGTIATLDVFQPSFLREIDLELFGVAISRFDATPVGESAGARTTLSLALAGVPLSFYAQVSRRFTYDETSTLVLGVRSGY
jgi:hypothetical protein